MFFHIYKTRWHVIERSTNDNLQLELWLPLVKLNFFFIEEAADSSVGEQCDVGHYCPEATTLMIQCSQGTYNPSKGGRGEADCR